jgi:hypothetical protein
VLEPRGTRDVDVNVFVDPQRARDVFAAMPEGVEVSGLQLEHAERDGQVRLRWGITPIDLFFSVLPVHDRVQAHIREVPSFSGGASAAVASDRHGAGQVRLELVCRVGTYAGYCQVVGHAFGDLADLVVGDRVER